MKNRYEFLSISLIAPLLLFSSPWVHAQQRLPDAPEVLSFTIAPQYIHLGQAATLVWRTGNTDHVFVGEANPEWPHSSSEPIRAPRQVEASGSLQVSPPHSVTYRLEARKGRRSVFYNVTVEVSAPPRIHEFTATPRTIRFGQSSLLRWRVSGDLEHVWISRDRRLDTTVRVEPGVDSLEVSPDRSSSYQLHIRGRAGGDVERDTDVRVSVSPFGPPRMSGFHSVELCRRVIDQPGTFLCRGFDGPFRHRDDGRIEVIARFLNLPVGRYEVQSVIYRTTPAGWREMWREDNAFTTSRAGYREASFSIPTVSRGWLRLNVFVTGPVNAGVVPRRRHAAIEYRVD